MQGLDEGLKGFQNIRVIFSPLDWYELAKMLTLALELVVK